MSLSDQEFLDQFEDCTLPFEQWKHRAHVKIAYLLLTQLSFDEAVDRMRAGIKAFNAANDVPEGPTQGYHETMTQAWLRLIHGTIQRHGPAESADAFFDAHPELWQSKILRLFYSPERFMSAQAKTEYLEPDLTPFPVTKESQ